jgi:subtilisin family serine protease
VTLLLLALLAAAPAAGGQAPGAGSTGRVEVVVELDVPPAARVGYGRGQLSGRARAALQTVARAQRRVERHILARIPEAEIRWRYGIVLAGLAVVVPENQLDRLAATPGIVRVYPSVRYHALLDDSPSQIGAPAVWGPGLENAGRGLRIGIIDDGIDPGHPFFDDDGFTMPGGFPKGDAAYTSAKVIVARAFPPPGASWRHASRPFDPRNSFHGTHVAGIAAGNHGTAVPPTPDRAASVLSGVAPLAYLGNYRALTIPTDIVGLNGNSPELVAAIEAAVADGMDVINLSLGEPEVEPSLDAVAIALDNAAAAGVVPVVSAGNDYELLGRGSISSPGTSQAAITVAAVTGGRFFGVAGRVVGPEPVPPDVQTFGGLTAPGGMPPSFGEADQTLVDAVSVDPAGLLCIPLEPAALQGRIVLARGGGCTARTKDRYAAAAGALGIVLTVAAPGDPDFVPATDLPLLVVSAATGARLSGFVEASGGEILVRIDPATTAVPSEEAGEIANFSGSGPTPLSLAFKPDLAAPGVGIVSAQPRASYDALSGTSMAAPHVAGAAALLLELHPDWTVEQLKSALVQTADPAWLDAPRGREAAALRQGGGILDLPAAADPVVLASPQSLAFGLLDVRAGTASATRQVTLDDAGGGAGRWSIRVAGQAEWRGAGVEVPADVVAPGSFAVTATAGPAAEEGERAGFLVLERGGTERRIPFWFRVTRPRVPALPTRSLPGPGVYATDVRDGRQTVSAYRYPDRPRVAGALRLRGPEQAFRIVLDRPAANFGVAVVDARPGIRVQPRILLGADENRLAGAAAVPYVGNPYLPTFHFPSRTASVLLPVAGRYTVVLDSPRRSQAGRVSFRVWIDDTTPPAVRLESRVAKGDRLFARVRDRGAGVDPAAIFYRIDDGPWLDGRLVGNRAVLEVFHITSGRHRLELSVSDRQEAKNNENLARVLPNTRVVRTTIQVP